MYSPRRVVSTCLAFLLFGAHLHLNAQQPAPVETELSMQHVFESASLLDPTIQAAEKRMAALQARRNAANAWTREPLAFEGAYRSDRSYNNQGLREIELGLSAPLWNWKERARTQELRDTEVELARLQLEQARLELAGAVRQTVWNALAARVDLELAQTRSSTTRRLMRDVEKRVAVGELAQTDFYLASASYQQSMAELARTQSLIKDLAVDFEALTGLPVSTISALRTEQGEPQAEFQADQHPAIKLAQLQVQALQLQGALVASQQRANPEVGVAIVSDRGSFAAGSERSLMLSTRIPLGNAAEYESRVFQAESEQIAAQAALSQTKRRLAAQSHAARAGLNLFAQIRNAAQEQARMANTTYRLYKKSFELGETDLPTLLQTEQKAHEAARLARKSEIEYAAKVSNYQQALGFLP